MTLEDSVKPTLEAAADSPVILPKDEWVTQRYNP
jgi:hypothetical protein